MRLLSRARSRDVSRAAASAVALLLTGGLLAGCGGYGAREDLVMEGDEGGVTAGQAPEPTGTDSDAPAVGVLPQDLQTADVPEDCLAVVDSAEETPVDEGQPWEDLYPAFEVCTTVEDFRQAVSAQGDLLDGNDPVEFVVTTCDNEPAVVDTVLCAAVLGEGDSYISGEDDGEDDGAGSTAEPTG
ncbi:hypothetical protein [Aquipuribacter sp. SD81]|uniref:hypothetical protein n=1 Tax=Aquipuribacter sp. SD81 TaxID=3127703 RepID=UPI00301A2482